MKDFWCMVEQGKIKIISKQACIDAWNDTPNMPLQDFIEEAVEYGWIEEVVA